MDYSCCDALKLDPDVMTTSFHPGSTSISSEIDTFIVPNRRIQAELNTYTGSLVVCLATKFMGSASPLDTEARKQHSIGPPLLILQLLSSYYVSGIAGT